MFNFLACVCALVYGSYELVTGYGDGNTKAAVINGAVAVLGLFGTAFYGKPYLGVIPNLFAVLKAKLATKPKPDAPDEPEVVVPDVLVDDTNEGEGVMVDKTVEMKNYEYLIQLRNQVVEADNQEGIDACNKLANVLFTLGAKKDEAKVEKVEPKDATV